IALDELRAGERVHLVLGIGVVEPGGETPAFVDLVGDAVGGDPLLAPLGPGIASPFDLALPVGVRRGPPQAHAQCLSVNDTARLVPEFPRLIGETRAPALSGVEIEAKGMGKTRLGRFLEKLTLVEDVHLIREAPALSQGPAILTV